MQAFERPPATGASLTGAKGCAPSLRIQHLLWLYLPVVPLLLWLLYLLCQGGDLDELDATTPPPALYAMVFGVPHVVASFFAFGNFELARACRVPLIRGFVGAVMAVMAMAFLLDNQQRFGLLIGLTLLHVVGQQTGLAVGQAGLARADVHPRWTALAAWTWKGLLGVIACATGLAIGGEALSGPVVPAGPALQAAGLALCLSTPLAGLLGWRAASRGGDPRAVLAMQMTATVAYGLVMAHQPWLGVLLMRWTHDATAFVLYAALAMADDASAPARNCLWAPMHRWRWPARSRTWALAVGIWPLAIALTIVLTMLPGWVAGIVVLTHYFSEPALWRRGSALREALPLR
ncbi:MAG TPA: hypothetical protein VLA61_08110 [Ideonella sp.]|uniref:hypothetical protein n=1 Tax=Ideonella sp. TaxID=1929293 RepID=UPI002C53B72A|nr:hypothetical protein [Ideonella sp.]HSI48216.1 hypothetical protein [Ideonella sp.]